MSITYQSKGTDPNATGTGTGSTAPAPDYPASIALGDLLVLVVGCKPFNATINTPAGWTAGGTVTDGSTASGVDSGSTLIALFYKVASGSESGSLTLSITSGNTAWAQIYRFSNATGYWDVQSAAVADTGVDTSWSVNFGSTLGITSGDHLIFGMCKNTDTSETWGSETLAATSATIAAVTNLVANANTTTGNDCGGRVTRTSCTSGTASGNATWTSTLGTARGGSAVILRIREITPTTKSGSDATTETEDTTVYPGSGGAAMPTVAWTAAANNGISSGTASVTFAIPSGAVVGQTVVAAMLLNSGSNTCDPPDATWYPDPSNTIDATGGIMAWVFTHTVAVGEPGTNKTFTMGASGRCPGVMVGLDGAYSAHLNDVTAAARDITAGLTLDAPAVVTSVDNDFLLSIWGARVASGTIPTITPPAGTHTTDVGSATNFATSGANLVIKAAHKTSGGVAGTFGPYQAAVDVNSTGVMFQLAVRPAPPSTVDKSGADTASGTDASSGQDRSGADSAAASAATSTVYTARGELATAAEGAQVNTVTLADISADDPASAFSSTSLVYPGKGDVAVATEASRVTSTPPATDITGAEVATAFDDDTEIVGSLPDEIATATEGTTVDQSAPTAKSGADTATATEAISDRALSGVDSAAAADVGSVLETGATKSGTDSASSSEAISAREISTPSDSAAATEAGSKVETARDLSATDAATAVEAISARQLDATDAGSAVDDGSVAQTGNTRSAADSAAATDVGAVTDKTFSAADSAVATDAGVASRFITATDSATATEAVTARQISASDAAGATETSAIVAQLAGSDDATASDSARLLLFGTAETIYRAVATASARERRVPTMIGVPRG